MWRGVAPDEALHQLVGGDVQLGAGDILEADGDGFFIAGGGDVNAGRA